MVSFTEPGVRRDTPTLNLAGKTSFVHGYVDVWKMAVQKR
jgi:hypothetical protein